MKTLSIPLGVIALMCLAIGSKSQEKKDDYGWQVGKRMPFHVVDWVTSPAGKSGAGCPSVMTSNAQGRSVIIWSKTGEEQAYDLAVALNAKLKGDKKQMGFFVRFRDFTPDALKREAEKHDLKNFHLSLPRRSAGADFETADLTGKAGTLIFVLDRKEIKATWAIEAGQLTKDRIATIVKDAEKHLFAKE